MKPVLVTAWGEGLHRRDVDAVPARISDQETFRLYLVAFVRIGRGVDVEQSERLGAQRRRC